MSAPTLFVLSPATLSGVRGRRILAGESGAPFMTDLAAGRPVPLGDVYAFISSLYFRGKRAYADAFGHRGEAPTSSWVVTPDRGMRPVTERVDLDTLRRFASVDIAPDEPVYREALEASAREIEAALGPGGRVVLLGSVASARYVEPLAEVFGRRLHFPRAFIGRGDMSRGGLLLRAVEAGEELEYVVAVEADRRGSRPPRLSD